MADYRLIAVDLDGTLLDSNRRVSESNRRALERARRAGVQLAMVTGRRLPAAVPSLSRLGIDFMMVLNGGALIKERLDGPILKRELLNLELCKEVLELARGAGVPPVIHDGPEGEGHLILDSHASISASLELYLDNTVPAPAWVDHLERALIRDPVQIMFAATVIEIRRLAETLHAFFQDRVTLARTEYEDRDLALLDVLAPQASKEQALRFITRHLGIRLSQTVAIGDNWNDLGMLEAAGLAVVMANATPALKRRGFAMTAANDENGVAQAIEKFVLKPASRAEPS